jgi:hypothetical protein
MFERYEIKPDKISIDSYEQIWRICGNQMYNQMLLNDFTIRREKFLQQELDERVNLWMVVAITISGVMLSGIQLMMSYRLASAGRSEFAKDSELIAEQGKISFRSSVTGVAILSLSLIFFIVYVKWIYTAQDILTEKPVSLQGPTVTPRLIQGGGALGLPKIVQPENGKRNSSESNQ